MTPLACLNAGPTAAMPSSGSTAAAATPPGEFTRCMERAQEQSRPDADRAAGATTRDATAAAATAARRGRDNAAAADDGAPPAQHDSAQASDNDSDDEAAVASAAPDLSLLLPGWPQAVAVAAPPLPADAATTAPIVADVAAADGRLRGVAGRDDALHADPVNLAVANGAALPVSAASARTDGHDGAPSEDAGAASSLAAGAAAPLGTTEPRAATAEGAIVPSLAAAPSPALSTAHIAKAAETAPTSALIGAAIDTPSFAPSLATQLRWWANEGVQQAQLQLNPAEMGPVAVRIVVDGRDARIDFSADSPATRSALESALPVLAAALDEGGLKLAGGGVHDGAAQRQAAWQTPSVTQRTNGGTGPALDDVATATAARGAAARGLVDLVA